MTGAQLSGSSILDELKASGIEFIATVPDLWTSEALLRPLPDNRNFKHVKVCKEDEGFGFCAGLAATGKRAAVLIQYTGLLDSINALRVVGVEFSQPICMIVGLLFKEPGVPPSKSGVYGVKIIEPILDAMGVRHILVETEDDLSQIRPAIEQAYANSRPLAVLIGGSPTP